MRFSVSEKQTMMKNSINNGCEDGSLPFWYLVMPIPYRKLRNAEWNPVEVRFAGKLSCWQSKLLSHRDRLVLINFVPTNSMPMFMFSFPEVT
jgi:hypothetical protein